MEQKFKGKLISFETPRYGETDKGLWASVSFILEELNPANASYAQQVKLDMFKNGEYFKYAKDFEKYNKIGDVLEASYNFKVQDWTDNQGVTKTFGKVECWKLEKVEAKSNYQSQQTKDLSQVASPAGDEYDLQF
jgi:hypothetical protein